MRSIAIAAMLCASTLSIPAYAADTDAAALAPLTPEAKNLVQTACSNLSGDGPRAYHECLQTFPRSEEIRQFQKMAAEDRALIVSNCAPSQDTSGYRRCLATGIETAAGIAPTKEANPDIASQEEHTAWWEWGAAGLVVVVALLLLIRMRRRRPTTSNAPQDPYHSGAARNDFNEKGAFGDAAFASASDLHQSMKGADSHGQQPQFDE